MTVKTTLLSLPHRLSLRFSDEVIRRRLLEVTRAFAARQSRWDCILTRRLPQLTQVLQTDIRNDFTQRMDREIEEEYSHTGGIRTFGRILPRGIREVENEFADTEIMHTAIFHNSLATMRPRLDRLEVKLERLQKELEEALAGLSTPAAVYAALGYRDLTAAIEDTEEALCKKSPDLRLAGDRLRELEEVLRQNEEVARQALARLKEPPVLRELTWGPVLDILRDVLGDHRLKPLEIYDFRDPLEYRKQLLDLAREVLWRIPDFAD